MKTIIYKEEGFPSFEFNNLHLGTGKHCLPQKHITYLFTVFISSLFISITHYAFLSLVPSSLFSFGPTVLFVGPDPLSFWRLNIAMLSDLSSKLWLFQNHFGKLPGSSLFYSKLASFVLWYLPGSTLVCQQCLDLAFVPGFPGSDSRYFSRFWLGLPLLTLHIPYSSEIETYPPLLPLEPTLQHQLSIRPPGSLQGLGGRWMVRM